MIMKAYRLILVHPALLVAAACALLTASVAADYDLSWFTIDSGGDMWTTGGDFELSGTIGQPDAGPVMTGGGFQLVGGFWPVISTGPSVCVGDLNCDGWIDFGDINPFVMYLSNYAGWEAKYPGCNPLNGDINGDGVYGQGSFGDINPFVALLSGGGLPIPCP
jgi:hypothetical protein